VLVWLANLLSVYRRDVLGHPPQERERIIGPGGSVNAAAVVRGIIW
jgi:hypothetical protein